MNEILSIVYLENINQRLRSSTLPSEAIVSKLVSKFSFTNFDFSIGA
jgi:hypothetical protein